MVGTAVVGEVEKTNEKFYHEKHERTRKGILFFRVGSWGSWLKIINY